MTHTRLMGIVVLCATVLAVNCAKKAPQSAGIKPPPPATQEAPPPPPLPAADPTPTTAAPALSEGEIFGRQTLGELNAERPSLMPSSTSSSRRFETRRASYSRRTLNGYGAGRRPELPLKATVMLAARGNTTLRSASAAALLSKTISSASVSLSIESPS